MNWGTVIISVIYPIHMWYIALKYNFGLNDLIKEKDGVEQIGQLWSF